MDLLSPVKLRSILVVIVTILICSACTSQVLLSKGTQSSSEKNFLQNVNWIVPQKIPPFGFGATIVDISCADSINCISIAYNENTKINYILTTNDGGKTWNTDNLPQNIRANLISISCPTVMHCVIVGLSKKGSLSLITNDGGSSWAAYPISDNFNEGPVSSVSCPTSTYCVAVKGYGFKHSFQMILISRDGGKDWSSETFPVSLTSNSGLNDITCATTSDCEAVGQNATNSSVEIFGTKDSGKIWKIQKLPNNLVSVAMFSVACPSSSECLAVGGQGGGSSGVIFATFNGGKTWVDETGLYGLKSNVFYHVTCATTLDCIVTGGLGQNQAPIMLATTNGGKSWSDITNPIKSLGSTVKAYCPDRSNPKLICYIYGVSNNKLVLFKS